LNDLIDLIKPSLESSLLELAKSSFNDDPKKLQDYELSMDINDRTIEEYLSDLEKYINLLLVTKNEAKTKIVNNKKENVTAYTKQAPLVNNDEVKDKVETREENKFLEQNKFREIASEYWERRKNKTK
jgi:coiled-coil domain-containing protein 63/114